MTSSTRAEAERLAMGMSDEHDFRKRMIEVFEQALTAAEERGRQHGLEEAAKKMDELYEIYKSPQYAWPNGCLHSQIMAKGHAEHIRELKQPRTDKER